jgi:hypothetical protein
MPEKKLGSRFLLVDDRRIKAAHGLRSPVNEGFQDLSNLT